MAFNFQYLASSAAGGPGEARIRCWPGPGSPLDYWQFIVNNY